MGAVVQPLWRTHVTHVMDKSLSLSLAVTRAYDFDSSKYDERELHQFDLNRILPWLKDSIYTKYIYTKYI